MRDSAAHFAGRDDIYNPDYYRLVDEMAARSVGPMSESVLEVFAPRSVVDVGCGTGALLALFAQRGVVGAGLEYSEAGLALCRRRGLEVAKFDLTTDSVPVSRRFDVAVSTEVAEHVSAEFADRLVDTIANLSSQIVFTAAVPGQGGGTDHVNEQPHEYWITKFQARGFIFEESISLQWRRAWEKKGVEARYWRNVMVFRK